MIKKFFSNLEIELKDSEGETVKSCDIYNICRNIILYNMDESGFHCFFAGCVAILKEYRIPQNLA